MLRICAEGSSEETNDLNRGEMYPKVQECATYNIGASATDTGGMADKDTGSSDIDRMVREVAAEMEIDAKKAMEDLRKDKELWNRVQRLKADRKATAGSDQNETKAEGLLSFLQIRLFCIAVEPLHSVRCVHLSLLGDRENMVNLNTDTQF